MKEFYVYVFLDQRKPGIWTYGSDLSFGYQPFYVGVGKKYRMTAHFTPFNQKKVDIKNNIIKKIKAETGELPIHYRIAEKLTQEEALKLEVAMIAHFGRIREKTGILANLTEGGEGNYGLVHTEEYLDTVRKPVYQYDSEGNFVRKYKSNREACILNDLPHSATYQAIKLGCLSGGFQWRSEFVEKLDPIIAGVPKKRYTFAMSKNGELIKEFGSKTEIENYLGRAISFGNLSSCCSGKLKTYLGYNWSKHKS